MKKSDNFIRVSHLINFLEGHGLNVSVSNLENLIKNKEVSLIYEKINCKHRCSNCGKVYYDWLEPEQVGFLTNSDEFIVNRCDVCLP